MVAEQLSQLNIGNKNLLTGLESMQQHTRELQDSVMSIRAQPVKSVFQRMPRLVRELAGSLHKDVRLVTSGEGTEVDKTVIEQLSDPLTHMIRNSVDHGIEMPDKREALGKPREGTIHLSAEHRSGRIVIQVIDDGGGIDRERVKQKCIEKGLINPDAQLTDEEIDNFIFLPGFSTAEKVSNVSGRGVGMDVVKKNIQALGGRVNVINRPGQGSRFVLSLPLTLAVLDGMVVTVGEERYVLPLTSIIELLHPTPEMISKLVTHGDLIHIRGEYIRLLYVHKIFNIGDAVSNPIDALVVLVEVDGGQKVGLVVDEVIGQQQVVIKSLESNYRQIEGVSAATILGDGRVALILDVIGLRQIMMEHSTAIQTLQTA
jgi:two-component system, chemotaxis family, sensor kinase CheA